MAYATTDTTPTIDAPDDTRTGGDGQHDVAASFVRVAAGLYEAQVVFLATFRAYVALGMASGQLTVEAAEGLVNDVAKELDPDV